MLAAIAAWAHHAVEDGVATGILLFGSLARADHAPGSDADLLVVIPETSVPFSERERLLPDLRVEIPVQLLVYTEAELQRLVAQGYPLVRRALSEGRWLAGGAPVSMAS